MLFIYFSVKAGKFMIASLEFGWPGYQEKISKTFLKTRGKNALRDLVAIAWCDSLASPTVNRVDRGCWKGLPRGCCCGWWGRDPTASWLIRSLHECGFKDSPAAQFDQIRALRPRFSSWTGTHRGVNDRTMRALMHRKTSGKTLRKTDSLAHVRTFWVVGCFSTDLKHSCRHMGYCYSTFFSEKYVECTTYMVLENCTEIAEGSRSLDTLFLD